MVNLDEHFQGSIKYCFHFSRIWSGLECLLIGEDAYNRNYSEEVLQEKQSLLKQKNKDNSSLIFFDV